ncbi:(2Fe-2S) ferredoxin domain-containing protein [Marivirga sp.]|uniref:(2Fe-2S) ferredoxin domain-containing protein n=1 Tax=Marivirga sp. TaxID=2018662 RepID=UPI002D7EE732|nr:(2Fe-2S) ferredoxin domain-containing protein [Marivirga sp.]HET8858726.1 (2Fe-2S) ferredoxin domain-containing protein [Marivirga sp.]
MIPTQKQNHHIFICTGKDCQKNGCEGLKSELKKSLKARNIKNVKIIKTKCMDYCKMSPNLVINGKLLHKCIPKDIPSILRELEES